jgi:hypothetical protein
VPHADAERLLRALPRCEVHVRWGARGESGDASDSD